MSENLAFRNLFCKLLGNIIGVKVLAFRTVLRMCWRFNSKYLAIEDAAKGIAKDLGPRVEPRAESFSSSSISLCMRERA